MRRLLPLLVLPLAACGSPPAGDEASPVPSPALAAEATGAPSPEASATPSPMATRDYAPPKLTPEAAKGEKGARNLLLAWAWAMEDRAFAQAYALFGDYTERTGMTSAEYVAMFTNDKTVTVEVGDGVVEGAAGSLYYGVPIAVYGTTQDGSAYRREGTIVLRRVNDVPGASAAQLRWHLDQLEWKD